MDVVKVIPHLICLRKYTRSDIPQETLSSIVLDPQYADYLALLKAARNGAVYGAKVRFPHALV